jgi:nitrate reductase gamma subunit
VLFTVVGFAGLGGHVYQAPVTIAVQCHIGDYYVYQHVGSHVSGPGFSFSHSGLSTLTPNEVRVRGPEGARVATWGTNGSETITKGSWAYVGAVGFHAGTLGNYQVHIAAVSPPAVIVGPSLGSQFVRAAPWLIMVGVGGLVAVVGLVVLIVCLVRRSRQSRIPPYVGGPPNPWVPPTQFDR